MKNMKWARERWGGMGWVSGGRGEREGQSYSCSHVLTHEQVNN